MVQVSGHGGAVMPGVTVTFSVASGSATLRAASVQTAADGIAGVSVTLGASAGPVVVTAAVTGLPPVQFQVTATLGHIISAIVWAGGSVPPVTRISPGGLATIYGANFAPPGTSRQVQAGDRIGKVLRGTRKLLGCGCCGPVVAIWEAWDPQDSSRSNASYVRSRQGFTDDPACRRYSSDSLIGFITFAASKFISFPHAFLAAKRNEPLTVTQTFFSFAVSPQSLAVPPPENAPARLLFGTREK